MVGKGRGEGEVIFPKAVGEAPNSGSSRMTVGDVHMAFETAFPSVVQRILFQL